LHPSQATGSLEINYDNRIINGMLSERLNSERTTKRTEQHDELSNHRNGRAYFRKHLRSRTESVM